MTRKNINLLFTVGIFVVACLAGCDEKNEKDAMDASIIPEDNFNRENIEADLQIQNVKTEKVQTDGLNYCLFGKYHQEKFGTIQAQIVAQVRLSEFSGVFGNKSAEEEAKEMDEEEEIEEVTLYLPFLSKQVFDPVEEKLVHRVDSVFGNKNSFFDVKVEELDYYLSEISTDLSLKAYYSNESFGTKRILGEKSKAFVSEFEVERRDFDNPTTEKKENENVTKLPPGIVVELDKNIFKEILLDKEGDQSLKSSEDFSSLFKGIVLSFTNTNENLMMPMDVVNAKIFVDYSYKKMVNDKKETFFSSKELRMSNIIINTFSYQGENTDEKGIYVGMGGKYNGEFTLPSSIFENISTLDNIITEACVYLYVDKTKYQGKQYPQYMLAYNPENGTMLDYTSSSNLKLISNKVEKDENGNMFYKINITDHLTNILAKGQKNAKIRIAPALTNSPSALRAVKTDNAKFILNGAVENPLGVEIINSGVLKPVIKVKYISQKK